MSGPAIAGWPVWRRHGLWLVPLLIFAAAGLLESVQASIGYTLVNPPKAGFSFAGQARSLSEFAARAMPSWIVLGLLAGLALRLARRRPLFAADWRRSLFLHVPAAVLFSSTFLFTAAALRHYLFLRAETGAAFGTTLLRYFTAYFNTDFLFYWGIVGVYSAFLYYGNLREREVQAEKLQRGLTEARLRALQQQLQPHFLFNTLNAVSGLALEGNTKGTVKTLALLGDLLRATLERKEQVVTVAEELELLEIYLALQRVRLEDRLQVRMRIDPDVLDAEVPTLLLQPLVENAIRHGVAPDSRAGWIEIAAVREGERVSVTVTDSGAGLGESPIRLGIGLSNCIARLEQLYGAEHTFRLENAEPGGARVVVSWPARRVVRVPSPQATATPPDSSGERPPAKPLWATPV